MTATQTGKALPIRLRAAEGSTRAVVEPDDQDRFMMLVDQVIRACRLYQATAVQINEFEHKLVPQLQGWVSSHAKRLSAAHLTLRDTGLLFVVSCVEAYDFELEDELTDLDVAIAEQHPDFVLDVLQTPKLDEGALAAFVGESSLVFDCGIR
jgi:hypothetical protein